MSLNSALTGNLRRVSATLAGLAMTASLAGLAVAGTASAAPGADRAETSSSVTGEYTAQVEWFYETFFVRRANCVTKGEIYEDEGYIYECRTAERNNRVIYELWLGVG